MYVCFFYVHIRAFVYMFMYIFTCICMSVYVLGVMYSKVHGYSLITIISPIQSEHVKNTVGSHHRNNIFLTGSHHRNNIFLTGSHHRNNIFLTGSHHRNNIFLTVRPPTDVSYFVPSLSHMLWCYSDFVLSVLTCTMDSSTFSRF